MVNRHIIVGRLGRDPELKYTPRGQAVCDLKVATTERFKRNNSDKWEEVTEWHTVVVWGSQAESCGRNLTKGRLVYIEGRVKTQSFQRDGIKVYFTKTQADLVRFLDRPGTGDGAPSPKGSGEYEEIPLEDEDNFE